MFRLPRISLTTLLVLFCSFVFHVNAATNTPVHVILWFDTEDYLLPASDDAALRLAKLLTDLDVKSTFKVVGEKARTLQRRGRNDVIEALRKHDIGYHSDYHSVHPTPTEYLAEMGLEDGMREFIRREMYGAADVRRIFKVRTLSCYGQPGSSWAPQAMAALRQIGVAANRIPCYVDDGSHIGLNEQPFWYEGVLTSYKMGQNVTRMDLHDPAALEPGKQKVAKIAANLQEKGGGLISIYYHPCEWVHQEFWDGVNFSRGANPVRKDWKAPRQLPPEKTEAAFKQFEAYVRAIKATPGVKFITGTEFPDLYPDFAGPAAITNDNTAAVRKHILSNAPKGKIGYYTDEKISLSLAEQFVMISCSLERKLRAAENTKVQPLAPATAILGPDYRLLARKAGSDCSIDQFTNTVHDVYDFLRFRNRIPSQVFIGADGVGPMEYLAAAAGVLEQLETTGQFPAKVTFAPAIENDCEKHIAKDTPKLFGDWIIHKEGFQAPKLLELARLQTWTLKPAILKK